MIVQPAWPVLPVLDAFLLPSSWCMDIEWLPSFDDMLTSPPLKVSNLMTGRTQVVHQLLTLIYKRHMFVQRLKIDSNFLYQKHNLNKLFFLKIHQYFAIPAMLRLTKSQMHNDHFVPTLSYLFRKSFFSSGNWISNWSFAALSVFELSSPPETPLMQRQARGVQRGSGSCCMLDRRDLGRHVGGWSLWRCL